MIQAKNTLKGKLNVSIVKEYPELEEITVTPTLDGQELKPSKYGYSKITVEGIPAIDVTIDPTIKEQTQTGIFKSVTVNAIEGQELNLNPTEEQQNYEGVFLGVHINPIQVEEITTDLDFSSGDAIELTPQEGAYIKKITINKPSNLSPENIKSGETVCGISGINADTSDADATSDDIVAGKTAYVANEKILGTYKPLDTSDATATTEDIAQGKTAYVNGNKVIGVMLPSLDTSQIKNAESMFYGNTDITEFPDFNASNVTITSYMFNSCTNLKKCGSFNIPKCSTFMGMFVNCTNLTDIGLIDCRKNTSLSNMFAGCTNLQNLGGLKNLGEAYNAGATNGNSSYKLDLSQCTKLTHESLMNVINNLYDLRASGKNSQVLNIGSTNKAKLTAEEIAIANQKNWVVS